MIFRSATIEDIPAIVKINLDTWKTAYKSIFPSQFLQNLSYKEKELRWRERFNNPEKCEFIYLAETDSKKIIGFSMGSLQQTDFTLKIPGISRYVGELMSIYILQEYQRRHIGTKLVNMVVERLLESEINSMIVWVLRESSNCKFYETLGGRYVGQKFLEYGGVNYATNAYGWDDLSKIFSK
ncbi:MAG: GNAT family N-acetyltransferase [Candidatus Lokiarchaeota archaeon]|nr:GNAT family N-acetyltransferase [Candidatus Lokiarchaeota archaeon]